MSEQDSNPTPLRVLFIGNSFTSRNDVPGMLTELAAASPAREVVTEKVIANGASLRQHWNAGAALQRIEEQAWDAVVLQEQSTLPIKNAQRYHENVRLFDPAIRKRGARTVLYLTWARQAVPETQRALSTAAEAIAQELGAQIVPVGIAWEHLLRTAGAPLLYDVDGSHPSPAGSYLAACVFFAALLGQTPEGLLVPKRVSLGADEAKVIQRAAWNAVRETSDE